MIRDIISNDSLTILLFGSIFFIIILKKIDPVIFTQNLSFRKKELVNKITLSQEIYAEKYGKNKSIESDAIKRKERIKNIDVELENWRSLKIN